MPGDGKAPLRAGRAPSIGWQCWVTNLRDRHLRGHRREERLARRCGGRTAGQQGCRPPANLNDFPQGVKKVTCLIACHGALRFAGAALPRPRSRGDGAARSGCCSLSGGVALGDRTIDNRRSSVPAWRIQRIGRSSIHEERIAVRLLCQLSHFGVGSELGLCRLRWRQP